MSRGALGTTGGSRDILALRLLTRAVLALLVEGLQNDPALHLGRASEAVLMEVFQKAAQEPLVFEPEFASSESNHRQAAHLSRNVPSACQCPRGGIAAQRQVESEHVPADLIPLKVVERNDLYYEHCFEQFSFCVPLLNMLGHGRVKHFADLLELVHQSLFLSVPHHLKALE